MDSLLGLVIIAFNIVLWTWLYRSGWYRPWIFVLIGTGWDRLAFGIKFWLFSRRRDKVDEFLDAAARTKRGPISGLIDRPDNKKIN